MVTYLDDWTYGYRVRCVNGIPIDFVRVDGPPAAPRRKDQGEAKRPTRGERE